MIEAGFSNNVNLTIPKHWLLGVAGFLWSGVGVLLCTRAIGWLAAFDATTRVSFGLSGIVLAIIMYAGGFHKVAQKNIQRICSLPARTSLFAFTAPMGYIMIGAMITLGVLLRNSEIPKEYLSIPYLAMGGALLTGSYKILERFWRVTVLKEPCISLIDQVNQR